MEKEKFNAMIADAAKTVFLYCRSRTATKEEAEDLSQDILLALLKSQHSLRDPKAFYGFMWAVAGNTYKNWCKKRKPAAAQWDAGIPDTGAPLAELLEKDEDLSLLRRELALLTKQYREVTILYYFHALKVSEIAKTLRMSQGMVKFLLFKSRQLLREGMNMERTKGDLSFDPRQMEYRVWGGDQLDQKAFAAFNGFNDTLTAQNILFACYNDRCTAEEISLQLGVATPYLERDLQELCAQNVLTLKGGRYETNLVIFTKAFSMEVMDKALPLQRDIVTLINAFLTENLNRVKAIGFQWHGDNNNELEWHIAAIIIREAVFNKYQQSLHLTYPVKYGGLRAFVWGEEVYGASPSGMAEMTYRNENGDALYFLEFTVNASNPSGIFFNNPSRVNIALDIAKGKSGPFNENEKLEIAELIKNGFLTKTGDAIRVKPPVFTHQQYAELQALLNNITDAIAEKTREIVAITTDVLVNHAPAHLKKEAKNIAWFKIFDCAAAAPVKMMMDNGFLQRAGENSYSTSHVVINSGG